MDVNVQNLMYWSNIMSKKVLVNLVEELMLRSIADLKNIYLL